ncbi:MAG: hypothetical protein ACRDT8_02505 [Micromonosporaceae bacterium]
MRRSGKLPRKPLHDGGLARGWRDFSDARAEVQVFVEGRAWTHAEGSRRLFDQAVAWLLPHVNKLLDRTDLDDAFLGFEFARICAPSSAPGRR